MIPHDFIITGNFEKKKNHYVPLLSQESVTSNVHKTSGQKRDQVLFPLPSFLMKYGLGHEIVRSLPPVKKKQFAVSQFFVPKSSETLDSDCVVSVSSPAHPLPSTTSS